MTKFKGKWDVRSYDQLTGSVDLNARRKFKTKQRIPFELQRGKKSKFFKKKFVSDDISARPIVELDDKFFFIPQAKVDYGLQLQEQLTSSLQAVPRHIDNSVYLTLSASVAAQFANLPLVVMVLGEVEAEGTLTGSYSIATDSALANSAIANADGYVDWTITNSSEFNTGATWSFNNSRSSAVNQSGVFGNELHQFAHTGSFIIRTYSSGSTTGSYVGQISSSIAQTSGTASRIDAGQFIYYTSSIGKSTAGFNRTILRANIFGDGDESTFEAAFNSASATNVLYAAPRELITFPYDTVVASGTFDHSQNFLDLALAGNRAASPRPAKVVTLYWASGSGGTTASRGLSGSISPSNIIPDNDSIVGASSGSHIFLNAALTQPASGGYYTTMEIGTTSGVATGHTIWVAGDGIRGNSTSGSGYFTSPFASAHQTSASLITVAPRWNGMSFTKS